MGDGPTLLAIRRAALRAYQATGEHPNAVFLDGDTLRELVDETSSEDVVLDEAGLHYVAGLLLLQASCVGPEFRRIVLPVHADLGAAIQPWAGPGAAA